MTAVNGKMWAGLVIHALILWSAAVGDYPDGFAAFIGVFLAMNVVGLLLIAADCIRAGCIMFIIGCVGFVPIGIIGLIGARNVMDELKRQEFAAQSQ